MGSLFDIPTRPGKDGDKGAINKIAAKSSNRQRSNTTAALGSSNSLLERISTITSLVSSRLGEYKHLYEEIMSEKKLVEYIDTCIEEKIVAIDTETTGLDPLTDKLVGISLFAAGCKAVYIPLHHVSYITSVEVDGQISDEIMKRELLRLVEADVKLVFYNAKFDIRFIKNTLGVTLTAYWDGYIATRLLNENEPENGLKAVHKKYCTNLQKDAFAFADLFSGVPFSYVPISSAYIYAARDAEITFELYKFQEPFLNPSSETCAEKNLVEVANLFRSIEMPLIPVLCRMEDRGIYFDFEKASELSTRYQARLKECEKVFIDFCNQNAQLIDKYKKSTPLHKLSTPINIASPSQISTLLYDILKVPMIDNKRGTGEEILLLIDHPVCKIILDHRAVSKLISTYIDKMQKIVNKDTKRIHCKFNQCGADTGRFSSSEPNMQNIPSHNKEIRQMFRAPDGWVLLSSDYSAQEPRLTAHMSGDKKMIEAYRAGKDLYAEIASIAFGVSYDQCLEKGPDGKYNAKGKERRGSAKAIVLGVCYGKGVPAIAEDLKISIKLAQEIYDKIMKEFPGLKKFMTDSENMAKEFGYVTTVWGRKRRLPKIQLPPYEFSFNAKKLAEDFDPLADEYSFDINQDVPEDIIKKYIRMLNRCRGRKERQTIITNARNSGIDIKDNTGYIAEAVRQCVNSRIQGSAADQTKKAMILIGNDEKLKELNFHLLLTVHDELIGECPKENAKEAGERLSFLMVEAAKELSVPSKCDVEITECWYGEPLEIE